MPKPELSMPFDPKVRAERIAALALEILQDVIDDWVAASRAAGEPDDLEHLAAAMETHAAHLRSGSAGPLVHTAGWADTMHKARAAFAAHAREMASGGAG